VVDGFRIDHPDGLADPEVYLRRLSDATDGRLGPGPRRSSRATRRCLPRGPCAGTTGYMTGSTGVQDALVDPSAAADLDAVWVGLWW
jgi:(1->4)-alpha-D-glucan 1-alpha-D-glucosylmutase